MKVVSNAGPLIVLVENCSGVCVVSSSNVLFKDIPPESVVAMYEAVYRAVLWEELS